MYIIQIRIMDVDSERSNDKKCKLVIINIIVLEILK